MDTIQLSTIDEGIDVEVSLERLTEELGQQGIIENDVGTEFFYLASLALEMHNGEYSIEEVLLEFIAEEDCIRIDEILN